MKNISKQSFLGLEVMLPPLAEQTRIADVLGDVDAQVRVEQALLQKKIDLREAVRQAILVGRVRLPGFADGWVTVRLGDLGSFVRGVSYDPDRDLAMDETAETFRLLRANNVQSGALNVVDLQFVHVRRVSPEQILTPGDLVICSANGSRQLVGKAAVYRYADSSRYTFGAFMTCFRPDGLRADRGFVAQLFQTGRYRAQVDVALAGSSINNLGPAQIQDFTFDIPRSADEQVALARLLQDFDEEIVTLVDHLEKVHDLKLAMTQALLSGRKRLA